MAKITPKKRLGQHFLTDTAIASKFVSSLINTKAYKEVIEIGPGMGMLTQFLLKKKINLTVIDLDPESVTFLKKKFPAFSKKILLGDFLKFDWQGRLKEDFAIIGNFPFNISSQIFFSVLNMRSSVKEVVGMIQEEVAQRIASPKGNKTYGILSVLLQSFYTVEYLFLVKPVSLTPRPKVDSAVIRLIRNERKTLNCDELLFFRVVKQGFQNRRKTLRNALKPLPLPLRPRVYTSPLFDQRAEQLSVDDFVLLTQIIERG